MKNYYQTIHINTHTHTPRIYMCVCFYNLNIRPQFLHFSEC